MAVSVLRKRGRWRRENQAGQGLKGHGNYRPRWSSYRLMHRKCFAARDKIHQRVDRPLCYQKKPERLIGDKAYDSDPLDEQCHATGITMIAPHKSNRKKPASQDSRALRRYKRRWKVERLFSWLQNYRRLVTCFEYYVENFLALLKLAAFMILAKKYL